MRRFLRVLADVVIVALLTACFCYYRETRAQFRMSEAEVRGLEMFCREIRDAADPDAKREGAYRLAHFTNGLHREYRHVPLSSYIACLGRKPDRIHENAAIYVLKEAADGIGPYELILHFQEMNDELLIDRVLVLPPDDLPGPNCL